MAADQLRRLLADPTRNAALIRLILGSPQVDLYTMPVLASALEPDAPHLRGVVRSDPTGAVTSPTGEGDRWG